MTAFADTDYRAMLAVGSVRIDQIVECAVRNHNPAHAFGSVSKALWLGARAAHSAESYAGQS